MSSDRNSPHERAQRLARLIVGEIALYNKAKIVEGVRSDTLFELLEKELQEGRRYYEKNVDAAVAADVDYFDLAVVDILVKGHGDVQSKIW
jgi:hypothetical protein